MANNQNRDDSMTTEEAGRKGGETTRDRYGEEFYEEIGSKGGRKRSENQDQQSERGNQQGERSNQQDDESMMEETI